MTYAPRKTKQEIAAQKAKDYDIKGVTSAKSLHVNVSNALNTAAQSLTLGEKRLAMMAVAKIDSFKLRSPSDLLMVQISAMEFAETFDIDPTTAYEQLRDAGNRLYNRSILFEVEAEGSPDPETGSMRWIGERRYHKGLGYIKIYFWPKLVPHLVNLRKQFTSYQLVQASSLRSVYSWRLLELLMQFESTGWLYMTIEAFCHAVDATPKQRENFGQIRRKIIEPAVKELTLKDGWEITWNPTKAGRRVNGLRFDFRRQAQGSLPL